MNRLWQQPPISPEASSATEFLRSQLTCLTKSKIRILFEFQSFRTLRGGSPHSEGLVHSPFEILSTAVAVAFGYSIV
jgi:hypothetical protein